MTTTDYATAGPLSGAKERERGQVGGRSSPRGKKERMHITMGERTKQMMNRLMRVTEASSYAEVIRNALRLYAALIEEAEKGNEFYVKDKDGNFTGYKVFM